MPAVSIEQALAFRLRRHALAPPQAGDPTEAVARVCGVQAQVPAAAEQAVAVRTGGAVRDALDKALYGDKSVVRTWAMRGTVHLLATADLAMVAGAVGESAAGAEMRVLQRRGHSQKDIDATLSAITEALGDQPVTREELAERVARTGGRPAADLVTHSWGIALKPLALTGHICFGPFAERAVTFCRVADWLPRPVRPLDPEEATTALLLRYLAAYAPATPADFAAWTGLAMTRVRSAWSAAEGEFATVDYRGKPAAVLAADENELLRRPPASGDVRLLPNFDVYLLGHQDKLQVVDETHRTAVFRKAGWISAVILSGGRVAGTWTHEKKGSRRVVRAEPFRPPDRRLRLGVERAAQPLSALWGAPVDVEFAEPTDANGQPRAAASNARTGSRS